MTTRSVTQTKEPQVSIDTAAVLRMLADCAESNCSSEDIHFLTDLRSQLSVIGKDFSYVTTLMDAVLEGRSAHMCIKMVKCVAIATTSCAI